MQNLPNLIRMDDLCTHLSIHRATLRRWVTDSVNPFPAPRYIKRSAYFDESEVKQWIEANLHDNIHASSNLPNQKAAATSP